MIRYETQFMSELHPVLKPLDIMYYLMQKQYNIGIPVYFKKYIAENLAVKCINLLN